MNPAKLIKAISRPQTLLGIATILVISLSFLIANSFQNELSGQEHYWIIVATVVGISILLILVLVNFAVLFRQYRRGEIGSKLSLRLISVFLLLNLLPLLMVYFFAVQFLNKGVDSWFDVRVERAIEDAVLLGETSLEAIKQDMVKEMTQHTDALSNVFSPADLTRALNEVAETFDYSEISIMSSNGQIIASSFSSDNSLLNNAPNFVALAQIRNGNTFSTIESISETSQQLKVIAPVYNNNIGIPPRALQAVKPLPLRYAKLAKTVESAKTQYSQMQFAREPLRLSLILTLTLISLASLLLSNLVSFFISRRIAKPLSVLASGTKEVASGNLDMKLPIPSNDEIGILVGSFNDMTQQLSHARQLAHRSQTETEAQREYLEAVLANLSSGVISINDKLELESCNPRASQILNIELGNDLNSKIADLRFKYENLTPFFETIYHAANKSMSNWKDERTIMGAKGKQFLIIQGSQLPHQKKSTIIVFDDVTNLIHAQKEAAWGEVARRLAHEIKNPLTPIQLSAERIKNKFFNQVNETDQAILEKTTRTIVQQVESLKNMVSAFSDYAQAINIEQKPVAVNVLLEDIAELHRDTLEKCPITLELDKQLPIIQSDADALRQVFNNLMLNAMQAMSEQEESELTIRSEFHADKQGDYMLIKVIDIGTGIKAEIRDTLFEPYVSLKQKGSGLGLAIVKRITENLGGLVWAEENTPKGTQFIVKLPIDGA